MDGWDLLAALKKRSRLAHLPVLIISANAEANRRGLALAGADYLLKPVMPEALLHALPATVALPGPAQRCWSPMMMPCFAVG